MTKPELTVIDEHVRRVSVEAGNIEVEASIIDGKLANIEGWVRYNRTTEVGSHGETCMSCGSDQLELTMLEFSDLRDVLNTLFEKERLEVTEE